MKSPFTAAAAVLALMLGFAAGAWSGDKLDLEPGFTRLDNGKDLEGWTGKLDGWSVIDGAIHLDSKKAKGNIYSAKVHSGDCIIRLQFRAAKGADSGVFIHGNQLQVRDYPKAGPKQYAFAAKPAGEWNDLEWDITKGVAVVKLNGKVIEKAWKIGGNAKLGVGLQREAGDFDFRFIRMKEK
ncbi:MAG: DUF1080 domain-containing protein [Gemmataceae bacterium]|nr:DUF1080 domain-containing protein [Gemmataceae bacterium]